MQKFQDRINQTLITILIALVGYIGVQFNDRLSELEQKMDLLIEVKGETKVKIESLEKSLMDLKNNRHRPQSFNSERQPALHEKTYRVKLIDHKNRTA